MFTYDGIHVFFFPPLRFIFLYYRHPVDYDEQTNELRFGQFKYPFDNKGMVKELYRTVLLFHENFCEALDLLKNRPDMTPLFIGKDQFYCFFPNMNDETDYCATKRNITISRPNMIHITCGSAKHSIVEDSYQPLLKRMPLMIKVAADAEFWVHNFKTLDWIPLNPDCAHLISFKLLDEKGRKVRLSPGYPTYIILKIRSYPPLFSTKSIMNPTSRFSIHISSNPTSKYPDNKPHHFFVDLPKTLQFEHDPWEVALTHICYPSKMCRLPSLNLKLIVNDSNAGSFKHMTLPPSVNTCEAIIENFIAFIEEVAEVKRDLWDTGMIQIDFKKEGILTLGSSLAYILGHTDSNLDINNDLIIDNRLGQQPKFAFKTRPKIVQLYPASLFLYSKHLCHYSLVGGRQLPILSVINHQSQIDKDNLYHNNEMEIINPNFIRVAHNYIQTLEFFLYSHDDNLIQFTNSDGVIFLSLTFQKILK